MRHFKKIILQDSDRKRTKEKQAAASHSCAMCSFCKKKKNQIRRRVEACKLHLTMHDCDETVPAFSCRGSPWTCLFERKQKRHLSCSYSESTFAWLFSCIWSGPAGDVVSTEKGSFALFSTKRHLWKSSLRWRDLDWQIRLVWLAKTNPPKQTVSRQSTRKHF